MSFNPPILAHLLAKVVVDDGVAFCATLARKRSANEDEQRPLNALCFVQGAFLLG